MNWRTFVFFMVCSAASALTAEQVTRDRSTIVDASTATQDLSLKQTEAVLALTIAPYDWQTIWICGLAALLLMVASGGTVWWVQRARLRKTEELEQSQEFTKAILDSMAANIAVLDERGVIVAVNARWMDFLQQNPPPDGKPSSNTGVGANYLDVCRNSFGKGIEEAMSAHDGILAVVEGRMPSFTLEYPCETPQKKRWFVMSVTPMGRNTRSVVVAHREVTERQRADQLVRESEQRLTQALEATSEGVWDWNIKTGDVYFSPQWSHLLGYSPDEVYPREEFFYSILHPDDVPVIQREINDHLTGRKPMKESEIRLRTKSGEFRWFSDSGKIIARDEAGQPTRMVGKIVDISQRKQSEQELALHRSELAHLARVSMLGQLAGTIAHELSQPLAAMLSNSQVGIRMIKAGHLDMSELTEVLDDIASDAKRAGDIIHGVRVMFRKETLQEPQPVDLNDVVKQVLDILRSEIAARKARIHLHIAESLPMVMARHVEIQQVLVNLIMNSLDATGNNTPRTAQIEITSELTYGRVVISVKDNGPGISSEMQTRLFEAFATSKPSGLGLGLSISEGLIKKFGGSLSGENHPDGGAIFRIELPVSRK